MSSKQKINELLREYSAAVGLSELQLDGDGYCGLVFDGKHHVGFMLDEPTASLQIYAAVGEIRKDDRLAAYQRLLTANYFWQATAGATLCLEELDDDETIGDVMLVRALPAYGLQLEDFRPILAQFIAVVEVWTQRLKTSPDQWDVASADESGDSPSDDTPERPQDALRV